MKINRFNADFGNSTNNFMIDGYYIEIPTNVAEMPQKKANEMFVNAISEPSELLERLMISTKIEGEEKYYLVGEMAELSKLSNNHVNRMHDKIKSVVPYVSFLSAVGYYNALNTELDDNTIEIEYMSMMLPIWLLKREEKFSNATKMMEERFIGEHIVNINTLGMEKELKVIVKSAKCRIESEVARHAIKYKMVSKDDNQKTIAIEKRGESEFGNSSVVLIDIGGGSTDSVKLGKGLTSPQSRDSFQVIDIDPFLGQMETLRKEKLLEHFSDLRSLEKFIISNYKNHKYNLLNENTGETFDFTEQITDMFKEYSLVLVSKILSAFKPEGNEVLKFVYFGGEAPILECFIKDALLKYMNDKALKNNHFFINDIIKDDPKEIFRPTPRTINLTALELLSINDTRK